MLNNQHIVAVKQIMETLGFWKNLLQKMNTNPKVYELSQYSKFFIKFIFKPGADLGGRRARALPLGRS